MKFSPVHQNSVLSRHLRLLALYSLAFVSVLCFAKGHCDFILGNLPSRANDNGALAAFEKSVAYSIGFTVGSDPLVLTSVDLRLRSNTDPGFATLELRSDNAGNPAATVLGTFGNQSVSSIFGTATFTPTGSMSLSAGTKYWLTIGTTMSSSNGLIIGANDPSIAPTGQYASFDSNDGIRSGLTNAQTFNASTLVSTPNFAINGSLTAVPEPATSVLIAIAAGLIIAQRYRNKRPSSDIRTSLLSAR